MKLYKNGVDLKENLAEFIDSTSNLFVFVPYIKLETLKEILKNTNNCKAIFVRWDTKDLITGACDVEIYPFCKANGIALYRNKRLHLKAYLENYKKGFIGSPNISARGLNIPENNFYNYELATIVDNLSIDDRLYFNIIEQDSILITDNIYNQILEQLPKKKIEYPDEKDFEIEITHPDKNFLISSLPMTSSVEKLFKIYHNSELYDEVELNCAVHDLALYKISFGLSKDVFNEKLKDTFFKHPFVCMFLERLNSKGEMYFGEVKSFIHSNCSNVPLPRRWEITENIQILYRWIVNLDSEKYGVDVPNYSERLYCK
jgi:hypothetical protein